MQNPLKVALTNPWDALRFVLDGPLHPGGTAATERLLDRAGVSEGTLLLDAGCGSGESLSLARAREAETVGLDHDTASRRTVRGDLAVLPVRSGRMDVVLAECVLCLTSERQRSVEEARRVLRPGGRLVLSDVVVEGPMPDLPDPITRALCLEDSPSRQETVESLERAGFEVRDVCDQREDLLSMRDAIAESVDYDGLLALLGDRGRNLRDGIRDLETAVERGRIGYVSLVAVHPG